MIFLDRLSMSRKLSQIYLNLEHYQICMIEGNTDEKIKIRIKNMYNFL